jgi:CBS domain containing-hemolysin-like protein/mannitol/fructose-specific phosphotransferase system IIA component
MIGILALVIALIALNAVFVLMEFALVRVRSSKIEMLARKGNSRAHLVQELQAHLDNYLAAIQLGITIVVFTLGWLGEPALARWVETKLSWLADVIPGEGAHIVSYSVALLTFTYVQTVFGELIPRFVGIHRAEQVSMWGAYPLKIFLMTFRLPIAFMSQSATFIAKLFGVRPVGEHEGAVSEEEMRILLGETQEKGTLPLERLLLLENLFDFGSTKASEAMVPLEKIAYLSLKKSWAENLEVVRARRYSRYPLCEDGLESVIGMVHLKDLLLRGDKESPDLRRLRRELTVVAEMDPLEKLLKYFPDKGIHMAMVSNAKGEFSGLVTLEDIVEELIGEVHDEFDLPQAWSLMDVVVPQAVVIQMAAEDRQDAIKQLLSKLKAAHPELVEEEVYKAVWDREIKFTSSVGRGVAVPHARLPNLLRPMVAVGRFMKPVPFPSPDNVPVRLLFLILTPVQQPLVQLKILSRIASLATNENLRRKLFRAKTSESMLDILRTADTLLAS